MAAIGQNRIEAAYPVADDLTVRLLWQDGTESIARFGAIAERGIFKRLKDPSVFEAVRVIDDGRVLAWPGDMEFCADALWIDTHGGAIPGSLFPTPDAVAAK